MAHYKSSSSISSYDTVS